MSSQLFYTIDTSNPDGDIEKKIIWTDEFIEIFSLQPSTERTHTFRISCILLSAMIQHFHYNVYLLWRLLADAIKYYDDRIIFSTQHIIYFPIVKDSLGREALRVYETRRLFENGESWKLEFFTNTTFPFDLEIHAKLSPTSERKHIYRVEGPLLRPYFEKHCLSIYVKRKGNQLATVAVAISNEVGDDPPRGIGSVTAQSSNPLVSPSRNRDAVQVGDELLGIGDADNDNELMTERDEINYEKETNFMLNTIGEELLYDKELDQLMIKSVDLLRLADYIEVAGRSHEVHDAMKRALSEEELSDLEDEFTDLESRRNQLFASDLNGLTHKEVTTPHDSHHQDDQDSEFFSLASHPPLDKYEKYTAHVLLQNEVDDGSIATLTTSIVSTVGGDMSTIASGSKTRDHKNGNHSPFKHQSHTNQQFYSNEIAQEAVTTIAMGDPATTDGQQSLPNPLLATHNNRRSKRESTTEVNDNDDRASTKSSASSASNMRNLQAKFKDLKFFSRTFDYSHYRQLKENRWKESMDTMVEQSKEDYKLAKQEAMLLSKNPLNDFVKEFASCYTNSESKSFMVRQAAAMRADQRSAMSTRVIMDFLQNSCKMANFLTYCSIYDLEVIANAVQLVDIAPPFDKTKIHYSLGVEFGDTISNIYIILSGSVIIDRLDTLLLDLNVEIFKEMDINSQWKYLYNHPQLYENKDVFSREELVMGDILGENVLIGEYGWTFHVQSLEVSNNSTMGPMNILDHSNTPNAVSLLRIPVNVLQRCIGRKGADVEEAMVYFWKMTRLWNEIVNYNKCFMQTTLFHSLQQQQRGNPINGAAPVNGNDGDTRQKVGPVHGNNTFQPMNSIESARLRTYQAGAEIFVQGQPRVYLYVIKQGSATYYRDFPKEQVGLDLMPERVETVQQCAHALPKLVPTIIDNAMMSNSNMSRSQTEHNSPQKRRDSQMKQQISQTNSGLQGSSIEYIPCRVEDGEEMDGGMLLSNDFSFMDSEDADIISRIEAQDEKFLEEIGMASGKKKTTAIQSLLANDSERTEQIFEYRKRRYHRFLNHKNSLIATTRCEVIVVPINEIAKCLPLFRQLIQLANTKYPMIMINNEEVIRQYYHRKQWEDYDKSLFLEKVSQEKLANRLLQDHLHFPHCYESDARYKRSPKQMLLSTGPLGNPFSPSSTNGGSPRVVNLSFDTSFNSPSRCRSPDSTSPRGGRDVPHRRPQSAIQSPRFPTNQFEDSNSIAPFTPKTPKSSSAASRPVSGRPRTVRQTLTTQTNITVIDQEQEANVPPVNSEMIKLDYLDKYKSILVSTVGKYEAENAEMMKILNSTKPWEENHKKELPGKSKNSSKKQPNPPQGADNRSITSRHRQQATVNRLTHPTFASVSRSTKAAEISFPRHESQNSEQDSSEPLSIRVPDSSAVFTNDVSPSTIETNFNKVSESLQDIVSKDDFCQYNFQLHDETSSVPLKKHRKFEAAENEKRAMQKVVFKLGNHKNDETTLRGSGFRSESKSSPRSPKKLAFTPDEYAQLYRERVEENPMQRFIDELARKAYT